MKILHKKFVSTVLAGCFLLSSTGVYSFSFFKKEQPKSSLLFFSKFFRKPKPKPYPLWIKATACVSIALLSIYLFDAICRQDGDRSPGIFGRLKNAILGSSKKEDLRRQRAAEDELDYTMDAHYDKENKTSLSQLHTAYQSGLTCGFHALKNAQLMRQFFECRPKNKKEKVNILRKINSSWEADDFLYDFDTSKVADSQYLQKQINQKQQQKDHNYDDLYVLDAIDQARLYRQTCGDNPIFIINSGGTTAQKAKFKSFKKVKEKKKELEDLEKELDRKENELEENVDKGVMEGLKENIKKKKKEVKKIKPEDVSDPIYHYYVAAIKKKENKCYVLDSLGTNHIKYKRGNIQRLFNLVKGNS